jgi:hypothetical protein
MQRNMQVKYFRVIYYNHPDTWEPVCDPWRVDAITLLVSEYKSYSSGRSSSFSETYKETLLLEKLYCREKEHKIIVMFKQ